MAATQRHISLCLTRLRTHRFRTHRFLNSSSTSTIHMMQSLRSQHQLRNGLFLTSAAAAAFVLATGSSSACAVSRTSSSADATSASPVSSSSSSYYNYWSWGGASNNNTNTSQPQQSSTTPRHVVVPPSFDHSALFRIKAALEVRTESQKVRLAQVVHDLHELAAASNHTTDKSASSTGSVVSPPPPNRLRRCVTMVMNGLSHRSTEEIKRAARKNNNNEKHWDREGHLSLKGINLLSLTPEHADQLIELLRNGAQLDKRSLLSLVAAAKIALRLDPTLIDLRTNHHNMSTTTSDNESSSQRSSHPNHQQVTVVGDLHGSMACLNNVLQLSSFGEHVQQAIVFDGDFVDRGQDSVEVLATLLLLKLAHPNHVFLLRGNHEDTLIASVYGFQDEIRCKYGVDTAHDLWDALGSLFSYLPIAARTDSALILHGGIPDDAFDLTRLMHMTPADRSKVLTVVNPATPDEYYLADILWSDPSRDHMGTQDNPRGHGKSFGTNVARNFLDQHKIQYLIRAHEPVERGLDEMRCGHGHSILTVFSNASYPNGEGTNLGAVVHLDQTQNNKNNNTTTSSSSSGNSSGYRHDTFSYRDACTKIQQRSQSITDETIAMIRSLIASRRHKLQQAFGHLSNNHHHHKNKNHQTRFITVNDWARVMSEQFDLPGMPWRSLLPMLATSVDLDPQEDQIDWNAFLQHNSLSWTECCKGLSDRQIEQLYDHHEILLTIFKYLDVDHKGQGSIEPDDFKTGFTMLNRRLPKKERLKDPDAFFKAIDRTGSGSIKIQEFGKLFQVQ